MSPESAQYRSENRYVLHPKGLRRCSKCREIKPLADFWSKGAKRGPYGTKSSYCKRCDSTRLADVQMRVNADPQRYCRQLLAQLRCRAKSEKCLFDLASDDLYQLWLDQNGCCYYTGLPMNNLAKMIGRNCAHPEFPSVDRKDPRGGYVRSNIVWTLYAVNRMKSDLTAHEFIAFCHTIADRFANPTL